MSYQITDKIKELCNREFEKRGTVSINFLIRRFNLCMSEARFIQEEIKKSHTCKTGEIGMREKNQISNEIRRRYSCLFSKRHTFFY